MKAQLQITNITHEDLVNLLAVATYNSSWFDVEIKRKDYDPFRKEGDCCEDKWAKVLLAGKKAYFTDGYAEDEDEFYGNLPHSLDEGGMRYEVTLDDIKNGLEKAWYSSQAHEYVLHLMDEPEQMDNTEAEALVQFIMFGEEIYG